MLEGISISALGSGALLALAGNLGPLATIVTVLVALGGLAGIIYSVRFRVSAEAYRMAAEAHKENAEAERERGTRLEEQLEEAHERERELRDLVTRLQALPDLSAIVEQIGKHDAAAASREQRAEERHRKLIGLFDTLGLSLGDLATQINERNQT